MIDYFDIRYCKVYFKIQFPEDAFLPREKVSMIRGGVGEMLLQQHCLSDRNCKNCRFQEDCPVPRIYYHPLKIKPAFVTSGESLGYTWECFDKRTFIKAGDYLCFQLILFGNTIIYFQDILQALYNLGMVGMGRSRAGFQIVEVMNELKMSILDRGNIYNERILISKVGEYIKRRDIPQKDTMRIRFFSPLSLKYQGKFLQEFQGAALIDAAVRRIYMLNCMEGNDLEMPGNDKEPEVLQQNVKKVQVSRYSNTHRSHISLHGICGECALEGLSEEMVPFLIAGELVHIGKNTSMGFGKYKIIREVEK